MKRGERESSLVRRGNLVLDRTPKDRGRAISPSKQGKCYKPLQRHFQRGEFNYKQLVREKDVAIYSQTRRGCPEPSTAFEVIRVRRHNGKEIKGDWVEPSEFYPSSTDWGKYGFTFIDKDATFSKLRELLRRSLDAYFLRLAEKQRQERKAKRAATEAR